MKRTIFIFFNTLVWTLLLTASQCPPDTNAKKSTHLVVPDVTTIAAGKYQNKGYTSIAFAGKKLKTIGENAFKGNKITTLTLPESVTHIEEGAFEDNDIEVLVLPKLTKLGKNAFKGNKLKEVTLREIIADFDKSAFANRENFSPSLPIFKVPTVEVMEWIVSKFTTTTADGKKSITIIVKTTDEELFKQAEIDKHVKKAKEDKKDDAGAGEDKEDDAGAGEDKKDAAGAGEEEDAGAGEEEEDDAGVGEDKKDAGAGEDKEDAGAGEADKKEDVSKYEEDAGEDKKEDVSKYEEGDTKVEEIATNTTSLPLFRYTRTKETGAVLHLVRRKGSIEHAKPLSKNEEAIYFLTNRYANEYSSYYLYKKGDNIRITLMFNNEVYTDKTEVEKLKSNVCGGKPYLELKFLTNKDTRQACLTSASSTLNKKLEFWYEVKDGDNEHESGIELVGSIIKQHTSIKDKNNKNVSKLLDGVKGLSKTQQTLFKSIVETKKPNVPPIKFRVRICKKDEKDKCSNTDKIFGINEIIEVRVLFNKNDIQALPEPTADVGDKANPYFTLHIEDKTIKAYYVTRKIPEDTYEKDEYSSKKKPTMIFKTSPEIDGANPEEAISIAKDSFQLSDATLKDIANRNIDTTLTARETEYKIVDKTKFYTHKVYDPRLLGCTEVEERLPDDGVKIADDDECKIKVEETP